MQLNIVPRSSQQTAPNSKNIYVPVSNYLLVSKHS